MMKKILVLVFFLLLASCQKHASVIDNHGNTLSLNHLNGKWLVVNYWATWCHNCTKDMQDLEKFYQSHKDKVIVLGVNFDELPVDKLNAIQKQMHISYPFASHFPINQFGVDHIDNLPRTYIFSPDGKMKTTLYGPQTETMLAKEVH